MMVPFKFHLTRMTSIPSVLRVKRRRTDDPLQALILEDQRVNKRSKTTLPSPRLQLPAPVSVYQLARTDDHNHAFEQDHTLLHESLGDGQRRQFVLKPTQELADEELPAAVSEMVDSFVNTPEASTSPPRKRRGRRASDFGAKVVPPVDEYVYDVYQLAPVTLATHPKLMIGYVQFFDDSGDNLYPSDDDKSDHAVLDDEDLNAELFYQNDYPSDEDAGSVGLATSGLYLDDDEIEYIEGVDYLGTFDLHDDDTSESWAHGGYVDGDSTRQSFFPTDTDDPMAQHRDRIFDRLQKMIDED